MLSRRERCKGKGASRCAWAGRVKRGTFSASCQKNCRRILRSVANLGTTATLCLYEIDHGHAFQLTQRPSPDWSDKLRRRNDGTYADVSDARRRSSQRKTGLLRTSLA